jgi:hypothetical protein
MNSCQLINFKHVIIDLAFVTTFAANLTSVNFEHVIIDPKGRRYGIRYCWRIHATLVWKALKVIFSSHDVLF